MLQRCYNPNINNYPDYGGRGIEVCDRWRFGENGRTGFQCFLEDMGCPPRGKSLDRINVNGNYEPSNCRWATIFEQARNKRPPSRRYDEYDNEDDERAGNFPPAGSSPSTPRRGAIVSPSSATSWE
jgi:hypothetical protein